MFRKLNTRNIKSVIKKAMINNELIPYYQPKIDIHNLKLTGGEALVRWYHKDEIISPTKFIYLLEKTGFICEFDYYMLDMVCKDISRMIKENLTPVRISINFSAKHIENIKSADNIIEIVKKNNIDPKYLEIELTELSSSDNYELFQEFINKLRKYGIYISMDDFGSGYSSLNMLRNVSYDIIKIDKEIIDGITNKESKEFIILKNMMHMIKELGMKVLAEGVENSEQLFTLKKLGCNFVQGYYFDKPLEYNDFMLKLEKINY